MSAARLMQVARLPALTEHVRRQGNVTEPCHPLRLLHDVGIEPEPLVDDEHAGPPAGRGLIGRKSPQSQALIPLDLFRPEQPCAPNG